ncbi:hypothetical protein KOI35_12860 [Actinoplanes bogorensis]|uniref:Uncharacterized protein n=1 Tax=Paractinoplanes bogorensis TaxID=1610840 RepID=A0ABS5YLS5_9ACTN|nr:hypothetical protein [Actinoplanes bogorensis]MBU2664387.1 hypothetical protein [Actinoplanes bogorensis]
MTETDVRDVLGRATEHLSPAPDLLDRVRAGGRRRVVRRRAVLGAAVAAVVVGGGAASLRRTTPAPRGDLAGDHDLLERMREAWLTAVPDGVGEIVVHWAGTTPMGPVGVLSQRSARTGYDLQGFVETLDEGLRGLAGPLLVEPGTIAPIALAGRAGGLTVLVIVTGGRDVNLSENFTIDDHGRVDRRFVTLHGDLVFQRPEHSERYALRVGADPVPIKYSRRFVLPEEPRDVPQNVVRVMAGVPDEVIDVGQWDVSARPGYLDRYGYGRWEGPTQWHVRGRLADGRRLVVQTLALDGAARAFWMAAPDAEYPTVGYLGTPPGVDVRLGNVPVLYLRLPDRLGVVVAAQNSELLYRVREGTWLPIAGDAALIPDAATELEVRTASGRPARYPLP